MMLLKSIVFFLTIFMNAFGAPTPKIGEKRTPSEKYYHSRNNCVALNDSDKISPGSLTHFTNNAGPEQISADTILNSKDAESEFKSSGGFKEAYKNKELWRTLRCYWSLKDELPERILVLPEVDNVGIAVKDLPKSAIKIGPPFKKMDVEEVKSYLQIIKENDLKTCKGSERLFLGRRFGPSDGHEIAEIFIGTPIYVESSKKSAIKKIKYCQLTIHNKKQVLASGTTTRSSGVAEHVDAEPPELNQANWADTSIATLGYMSLDQGKSWSILTANLGFEGIAFKVKSLVKNEYLFQKYHYTSH